MGKTEGARRVLVKIFYAGALLIFSWFFISGIFDLHAKPYFWIPTAVVILAALCGVMFLLRKREVSNKTFWIVFWCAGAVFLLLQAAAGYFLAVNPSWDFGGVFVSAAEWVRKGTIITHENYFNRFSNNVGLLVWEIAAFKILQLLGVTSPELYGAAGILMNIAVIDLSILFTVLFCRRTWGNARALFVTALCVFFTPYILYAPIFYTDSMSLIFVSLPLYLFSVYLKAEKPQARVILTMAIGILLAFGAKVKGSVAILLVAFCLYAVFNLPWKRLLSFLLAAAVGFTGCFLLVDKAAAYTGAIKQDKLEELQFPTEYWIYMGLYDIGGFHQEDFDLMYGLPTKTARQQAAREGIVQRLKEYGVGGMLEHLTKKAGFTFGDGTYFISVQLSRQPLKETAISPYFLLGSEKVEYFYIAADAYQALILLSLLAGLVLDFIKKKGFGLTTLLYVALFGLALFLMIWETRSRYLLNFTPIMLILMGNALWQLYELIEGKIKKRKKAAEPENTLNQRQLEEVK